MHSSHSSHPPVTPLRSWRHILSALAASLIVSAAVPVVANAASAQTRSAHVAIAHRHGANTITTLSAVPSGVVYGQTFTLHATVTNTSRAFTTSNQIQFYSDGAALGAAANVVPGTGTTPYSATASLTTSGPTAGAHSITAQFVASTGLNASKSSVQSMTILRASTKTVITSTSPASSVEYGQATTFNVNVTAVSPGSGVPTGSVAVVLGANTVCTVNLTSASNGSGNCTGAVLSTPASSVSFSATYSGSSNFTTSSTTSSLTVTKAATTISSFTAAPTSIGYGAETSVVFTATVAATAPGSGSPTGTVLVTQGSTTLCTITLASSTGHCSPASGVILGANSYTTTATYSGDGNFSGSTQGGALTVSKATVALSSPIVAVTPTYGGPISASTTLSDASGAIPAAGDVTFSIASGANHYTCDKTVTATGSVTCSSFSPASGSAPVAPVGTYSVTVSFEPTDTTDVAAAGPVSGSVFSIKADSTMVSVTPSASSTSYGGESVVTFSVTLTTGFNEPIPAPESATVKVGSASCVATLTPGVGGASGSCAVANTALAAGGPYAVSVSYAGDSDLSAAGPTSAPSALTVTRDSATLAVSPSPATVTYGAETNAVFSVTLTTGHGESLAGAELATVSIGSSNCTATLSPDAGGGHGTCSLASNVALGAGGPYAVAVTYAGDAQIASSGPTASTTPLTITKDSTILDVSAGPTSVTYGAESSSVLTASVTTGNGEKLSGSESITIHVGDVGSCLATLSPGGSGASGTCSVANAALPAGGPYDVSATYGGDSNLLASAPTSAASGLSVTKDSASLKLTESATSVVFGNESTVTFTATLTTGLGEALPAAEPLTISVGSASCEASLVPNATGASGGCSPSDVALNGGGPYSVTATYPGDADLGASSTASTSSGLTVTTDSTVAFPRVSAAPATVIYGNENASTFTVHVVTGNGEPLPDNTDTATVYVGTTSCQATLTSGGDGGSGSCSIGATQLPAGTNYAVSVYYSGDSSLQPAGPVAGSDSFSVSPDTTTLTVSASPTTVTYDNESASTFSVHLTTGQGEALASSEPVTVDVGSATCVASLAPVTGGAAGTCSIANRDLAPGSDYAVSVTYPGDANLAGTGPASALTGLSVSTIPTTTAVTATVPSDSIAYGQSTTFDVTVSPVPATTLEPTGAVAITEGPTTLCTVSLVTSSNGVGSCAGPMGIDPGSSLTFHATYVGDAHFTGSANTVSRTVVAAATSTALTASRNPSVVGASVTVTATVAVLAPGSAPVTGAVAFTRNGTTVAGCSAAPVTAGVAHCTLPSSLSPGGYSIGATYSGSADTATSAATTLTLLVDTRNTAFVKAMYLAILGRPADVRGLVVDNALLNSGHSRAQVAATLISSNEYKIDQFRAMTETYLHRGASSAELVHWITQLNHGATYEQIRAGILGSNEYWTRAGSKVAGFANHLYNDVLGRGVTAAVITAIARTLAHRVTRTQVALALLSSNEARTRQVHQWILAYLHRSNYAGTPTFVALLGLHVRDETIVAAMVGSTEFFNNATR